MKFLVLMLLFVVSCADSKQNKATITKISTNTISSQTNTPPEPIEPIEISYDKGLDLILVDSSFNGTISRILNNRDEGLEYEAVYWDSNNNQYYTIENDISLLYPIPVTNTNFLYTIDETKQHEPVFDSSLKEIFPNTKAPLLYIGSSKPLERVYLDPTNQVYYIKQLKFWDTSIYETWIHTNDGEYNHPYKPITNLTPQVYPYIKSNIYTNRDGSTKLILNTRFTNTNDQTFYPVSSDTEGNPDILYYFN